MDDKKFRLTIKGTGIYAEGFKNVQKTFNPEYYEATEEGYEGALDRMEELWKDPLNRRIILYLCEMVDQAENNQIVLNQVVLEDWNKDEKVSLTIRWKDEEEE